MATLADKGYRISKNIFFSALTKKAAGLLGKPGKIALLLHDAYRKLSSAEGRQGGFGQVREMMYTFMRLVRHFINGSYRQVSKKSLLIGLATLLYLVLPIDLVPDFIPALGLLDDLSLMAWFIQAFRQELDKFQAWEARQPMPV